MTTQIINKIPKMEKTVHILKILTLCTKDEERINMINYLQGRIQELSSDANKYNTLSTEGDYSWLYNKISNDDYMISGLLKDIEDAMYNYFRLVSIVILDNMKEAELVEFYDKVKKVLDNFSSVEEAAEYICFNSGGELTDFMTKLIQYIKTEEVGRSKKMIPLAYLEEHQTILTLSLREWVDIFNNIRYTLKYLTVCNKKSYKYLIQKYQDLILNYFIIITSKDFN